MIVEWLNPILEWLGLATFGALGIIILLLAIFLIVYIVRG